MQAVVPARARAGDAGRAERVEQHRGADQLLGAALRRRGRGAAPVGPRQLRHRQPAARLRLRPRRRPARTVAQVGNPSRPHPGLEASIE